jgi:hypothetical protein
MMPSSPLCPCSSKSARFAFFLGMAESIWSDGVQLQNQSQNQTLGRDPLPPAGRPRTLGKETCREDHAPSHRPQMSSGRLFLDRVARQHCPSPLHRHCQNKRWTVPAGAIIIER